MQPFIACCITLILPLSLLLFSWNSFAFQWGPSSVLAIHHHGGAFLRKCVRTSQHAVTFLLHLLSSLTVCALFCRLRHESNIKLSLLLPTDVIMESPICKLIVIISQCSSMTVHKRSFANVSAQASTTVNNPPTPFWVTPGSIDGRRVYPRKNGGTPHTTLWNSLALRFVRVP
jgi:hypothetical protein